MLGNAAQWDAINAEFRAAFLAHRRKDKLKVSCKARGGKAEWCLSQFLAQCLRTFPRRMGDIEISHKHIAVAEKRSERKLGLAQ